MSDKTYKSRPSMPTKSTITEQQRARIAAALTNPNVADSIGAVNLALTGVAADTIPDCMSEVIGRWIVRIQDVMSDDLRNSPEWNRLVQFAAGTGRELELERLGIILDWMWSVTLPQFQSLADARGFGESWREMCEQKTAYAACEAYTHAGSQTPDFYVVNATAAAYAATVAARRTYAGAAANFATAVAAYAARATGWYDVDPCALLTKLIEVPQ